ncbi:hypothetical protein HZA99_07030 [Candidatus Woesearchaeota archaeon]|nr:hypothetical protein [Candidatus Woesearchaeota archaeon]
MVTGDVGRTRIGATSAQKRIQKRTQMRQASEMSRDKSREKIMEMRRRYKAKVDRNERTMDTIKQCNERNLNPTAVSLIPSREYTKKIRKNTTKLSTIPLRPRYSRANSARPRIYGNRFEAVERGDIKLNQDAEKVSAKESVKESMKGEISDSAKEPEKIKA